jgi:hypothetical protein
VRKPWIWILVGVLVVMLVTPWALQQWVYPCLGVFLFVSLALLRWPQCVWDWGLMATAGGFLVGLPFTDPLPFFYPACWALFVIFFLLRKRREMRMRLSRPAERPRQGTKPT